MWMRRQLGSEDLKNILTPPASEKDHSKESRFTTVAADMLSELSATDQSPLLGYFHAIG